jgi:hypothetical protein
MVTMSDLALLVDITAIVASPVDAALAYCHPGDELAAFSIMMISMPFANIAALMWRERMGRLARCGFR